MATNSSALILDAPTGATNDPALADIHDIKPPVEIPSGWEWLWWTLGLLAVLTLCWLAWRLWKRRAKEPITPPVPAHVRARLRLTAALDMIHDPKPFCTEVSDTLRLYLEEQLALRAPERTTEEFLQELQGSRRLNAKQKESLAAFLEQCDLVKFAQAEPIQPELESLHSIALQLVEETQPNLASPEASNPAPDPVEPEEMARP